MSDPNNILTIDVSNLVILCLSAYILLDVAEDVYARKLGWTIGRRTLAGGVFIGFLGALIGLIQDLATFIMGAS